MLPNNLTGAKLQSKKSGGRVGILELHFLFKLKSSVRDIRKVRGHWINSFCQPFHNLASRFCHEYGYFDTLLHIKDFLPEYGDFGTLLAV
mmetsp:Transcript_16909/g.38047  ORF Transcript_16909/g.38047 Transcript_16909/m.38047 type:complete len:90 (-) Transcript_16909:502-771(-)